MEEFKECAECTSKPGMIQLCPSCLHNRDLIARLQEELKQEPPVSYLIQTYSCPGGGHPLCRSNDGKVLTCLLPGCRYHGKQYRAPSVVLEEI